MGDVELWRQLPGWLLQIRPVESCVVMQLMVGAGAGLWLVLAQSLLQVPQRRSTWRGDGGGQCGASYWCALLGSGIIVATAAYGWQYQVEVLMWLTVMVASVLIVRQGWALAAWFLDHLPRWIYRLGS